MCVVIKTVRLGAMTKGVAISWKEKSFQNLALKLSWQRRLCQTTLISSKKRHESRVWGQERGGRCLPLSDPSGVGALGESPVRMEAERFGGKELDTMSSVCCNEAFCHKKENSAITDAGSRIVKFFSIVETIYK